MYNSFIKERCSEDSMGIIFQCNNSYVVYAKSNVRDTL